MKNKNLPKKTLLLFAVGIIISITVNVPFGFADDSQAKADQKIVSSNSTESKAAQSKLTDTAFQASSMTTSSSGWEPPPIPTPPGITGGIFAALIKESFNTDLATGSANFSIPIIVPPGRKSIQPSIALGYSSDNPNGICGVGWSIPLPAIQRSTKNGIPLYNNTDNCISTLEGSTTELMTIGENEYRAKLESNFMKYVYSATDNAWLVYDKSGTRYYFGSTMDSQIVNPAYPNYIFAWCLNKVVDVYDNAITYTYEKDQGQIYLKYIDYTSNISTLHPLNADKRIEFVYETQERPDKIYNNFPGWQIVTSKRLDKIKISFDKNGDLAWDNTEVVWIYKLVYTLSSDTSRSLLSSVQVLDKDGNMLIEKTFGYQTLEQ